MSRWNALRPAHESETSFRKCNGGRKSDQSSRNGKRNFIKKPRNKQGQGECYTPNLKETRTLSSLKRLLRAHEKGAENDPNIISSIRDALEWYEAFVRESKSRTADQEFLLMLCEVLRIDDHVLHRKLQRLIIFLLEDSCLVISKHQVTKCINELTDRCYQYPSNSEVRRLLAMLVTVKGHNLPAEDLAQKVVAPSLLPVLESANSNRMVFTTTCKTISALILKQSHKSALLAPLVKDILPDGREIIVANPIRKRLLLGLEQYLVGRNGGAYWRELASCYLLVDIVDSLVKVDKNFGPDAQVTVNLSRMKGFFLESLRAANQAVCSATVLLLQSLLRYEICLGKESLSPAMLELLSRVVFDPKHKNTLRLSRCDMTGEHVFVYGNFLSLVHSSWMNKSRNTTDSRLATLRCLSEIVLALPWSRWLRDHMFTENGCVSGLGRKAINFLLGLAHLAQCAISRCDESSVVPTCYLVKSYFQVTKAGHRELSHFSTKLWSVVAETSLAHPSELVRCHLVDVLITSCGGQITPDGTMVKMYEPARRWLMSRSSDCFLDKIFCAAQLAAHPSLPEMKLLSSILRNCPQIAYLDSWARCNSYFSSVADISADINCLVLLDAVLWGQGIDVDDSYTIEPIREVVAAALSNSLKSSSVKIQCLGLSIFGALSTKDWAQMQFEDQIINRLVNTALNLCKVANWNVRSTACKSVGQFSVNYIPGAMNVSILTRDQLCELVKLICRHMADAGFEEKAQVRSMAMFAMGNLAHAIRTVGSGFVQFDVLVHSYKAVQMAMNDSSDKVVINAIRASGHWGNLLAHQSANDESDEGMVSLASLINSLVEVLATSIKSLSSETESLTWKKRGAVKKYGYGVCHSLGCIFEGLTAVQINCLQEACRRAIRQLVICIEHFWSLSLKLSCSAMSALGRLHNKYFSQFCEGSGILGGAIATCIQQLHENEHALSTKQVQEMESCLLNLLAAASVPDVLAALDRDYFSQATLSFLYSWMIRNDLNRPIFAIWAVGLRRYNFKFVDVSLEQSFISRSQVKGTGGQAAQCCPDPDDGSEL